MLTVKVPASTSNLGSGFDSIGLALQLYNTFIFEESEAFRLQGFDVAFNNNENLVLTAYQKTCTIKQQNPIPVSITLNQGIPLCGGLGSSATCIIAGVIAAYHFLKLPIVYDDIIEVATLIEGHPDNVAPALYGGLVSSFYGETKIKTTKYNFNPRWHVHLFIPLHPLNTKLARFILPKTVSMDDAVFNISRAINLTHALETFNQDLLYEVMQDKIHQTYRLALIPHAAKLFAWCYENKIPCAVSGSGASILMISQTPIIQAFEKFEKSEIHVSYEGTTYSLVNSDTKRLRLERD